MDNTTVPTIYVGGTYANSADNHLKYKDVEASVCIQ